MGGRDITIISESISIATRVASRAHRLEISAHGGVSTAIRTLSCYCHSVWHSLWLYCTSDRLRQRTASRQHSDQRTDTIIAEVAGWDI